MSNIFVIEKYNNYGVELSRAASHLVRYLRPIEKGHQVLISADATTDMRVVNATAQAVFAAGGIPTIIFFPTPLRPMEPNSEPLIGAASKAEIWFDFSVSFQLFSPAVHAALMNGCIYFMLHGMNADMMVRMIGQVDCKLLRKMATWLYSNSQAANTVHVETLAGTNLSMRVNKAGDPFWEPHPETGGYTQVLSGQSGFMIYRESVEGVLVIDGSCSTPLELGLIQHPITIYIKGGYIQNIEGDFEAQILRNYLEHNKCPEAYLIDHVCYGFNPAVSRLSGRILEDERLFGSIEFGIGATTYGSPVHSDAVCQRPSVWLDELQIEEFGHYIHPDLVELCKQMDAPGY